MKLTGACRGDQEPDFLFLYVMTISRIVAVRMLRVTATAVSTPTRIGTNVDSSVSSATEAIVGEALAGKLVYLATFEEWLLGIVL